MVTIFNIKYVYIIVFVEDILLCLNLQGKQTVNSCRQTQQYYISYYFIYYIG
jgi:hypothetical protein